MSEVVELRSLEIGERFIPANEKNKPTPMRYKVIEKCVFNSAAGTSTRVCLNENLREMQNKQCRLKVIKLPIKI